MNDSDELLPPDHSWDSEKTEREYHTIVRGIAEAEEMLQRAQAHLRTIQAVYDCFADTPGIAIVVRRSKWEKEESVLNKLNLALNPDWLPPEGRYGGYGYYYPPASWEGCLVAQKVEKEMLQGIVYYGREKKRTGEYVQLRITYPYEKRVEWYTLDGGVGVSGFEQALRSAQAKHRPVNALYDKLMQEIWQEVLAFVEQLSQQVVLKFIPDLTPINIEEIKYSGGVYKQDVPKLEWPPLAKYNAPRAGGRYGFNSYEDIYWVYFGRWELYQFPKETLKNVWERVERIEDRLIKQIEEAAREIALTGQAIMLLRRRRDTLALLYLQTPLISRVS